MIVHKRNIGGYRVEVDETGTFRAYLNEEYVKIQDMVREFTDINDVFMFQEFSKVAHRKIRKMDRDIEKGKIL